AEDGIRDFHVTGVQTCALPIYPVRTLQTLCEFLGESFESEMLDTSKSGAAVNRAQEPWKVRVTQSIEAGLVKRWKQEATVAENRSEERRVGQECSAAGWP